MTNQPVQELNADNIRLILLFIKAEIFVIGPLLGAYQYYAMGDILLAGLTAVSVSVGGIIAYVVLKKNFRQRGLIPAQEQVSSKQSETL